MSFRRTLLIAIAAALVVFAGGTSLNLYYNSRFQADVHANAENLAPHFVTLEQTSNIGNSTPEFSVQLFLAQETDFLLAKYHIESAAQDARKQDSLFRVRNSPDLEAQFVRVLKAYRRPISDERRYEFLDSAILCFIGIMIALWFIPLSWYFLLGRVRELGDAARGR